MKLSSSRMIISASFIGVTAYVPRPGSSSYRCTLLWYVSFTKAILFEPINDLERSQSSTLVHLCPALSGHFSFTTSLWAFNLMPCGQKMMKFLEEVQFRFVYTLEGVSEKITIHSPSWYWWILTMKFFCLMKDKTWLSRTQEDMRVKIFEHLMLFPLVLSCYVSNSGIHNSIPQSWVVITHVVVSSLSASFHGVPHSAHLKGYFLSGVCQCPF